MNLSFEGPMETGAVDLRADPYFECLRKMLQVSHDAGCGIRITMFMDRWRIEFHPSVKYGEMETFRLPYGMYDFGEIPSDMDPTTDVVALWSSYLAGGSTDIEMRNRLAEAHLPLVHYVAARMLPSQHSSVTMDDLASYGMLGLLDAVEKFRPDKGAAFSTFAWKRIQGSITDELRSQAWEPRALRRTHRLYQAEASRLEMALGRAPSLEELATAVDVSVEEISRVMGEMNRTRVASLSQPLAGVEVNDMTLSDVVVAQWAESEPVVKEMAVAVSRAVGRLPENEQLLLRLIYVQHMTLRDIALVLQVTDSWVSHLHTRSMVLLQRALAAQY